MNWQFMVWKSFLLLNTALLDFRISMGKTMRFGYFGYLQVLHDVVLLLFVFCISCALILSVPSYLLPSQAADIMSLSLG